MQKRRKFFPNGCSSVGHFRLQTNLKLSTFSQIETIEKTFSFELECVQFSLIYSWFNEENFTPTPLSFDRYSPWHYEIPKIKKKRSQECKLKRATMNAERDGMVREKESHNPFLCSVRLISEWDLKKIYSFFCVAFKHLKLAIKAEKDDNQRRTRRSLPWEIRWFFTSDVYPWYSPPFCRFGLLLKETKSHLSLITHFYSPFFSVIFIVHFHIQKENDAKAMMEASRGGE